MPLLPVPIHFCFILHGSPIELTTWAVEIPNVTLQVSAHIEACGDEGEAPA